MKLVEHMLGAGHEVPTAMLAGPEVGKLESKATLRRMSTSGIRPGSGGRMQWWRR